MNPPSQSITEALHITILLIYIYREEEDEPPGQSSMEALHTVTLYMYREGEREEGDEPPWSIEHRGLAYLYTKYIYIYI